MISNCAVLNRNALNSKEKIMSIVGSKDVLKMAMKIEQNREEFYKQFSQKINDERASQLFRDLAKEEKKHYNIFKSLLESPSDKELKVAYPNEYKEYLQAYGDTLIFNKELEKQANSINDITSAFDFSIRRELDSILLYQDMKQYASNKDKETLDNIIAEERLHFVTLTNKKKELASK